MNNITRSELAPIVLFVYNRPRHTRQTIDALKKNKLADKSKLFVFSDGFKDSEGKNKVVEVRKYIKKISGFKKIEIIEREANFGLANSIIDGVTKIINEYGKIIVMEDDLIVSSAFLDYMNNLLDIYKNEKKVFCVTGYNHPSSLMKIPSEYKYDIYFNPRAASWSWGTWKDRWNKADWEVEDYGMFKKDKKLQKDFNLGGSDMSNMLKEQMEGKIDSWAIRWCYILFKNNAYCIYPIKSYVNNIGLDGSGVHCDLAGKYRNYELNMKTKIRLPNNITLNKQLIRNFKKVYDNGVLLNVIKKLYGLVLQQRLF